MKETFKHYVNALAGALRQELPDVLSLRAEFAVDGKPYVITADEGGSSILVFAVIGALPHDEAARARIFGRLLHAQFCFSESCGFSFGVDADDSFVLLQAMINPECTDEWHFVALMEGFVKMANVWGRRLNESAVEVADGGEQPGTESGFAIQV